ncbi:MAG: hypothetical protein ACKO7N_02005, partial [Candidatus Nitrosotenuis sp.]
MATLYFYAPYDPDGGVLSNWYADEALTVPASNLPTSSDDIVILSQMDLGPPLTVNNCTLVEGASISPYLTVLGVAIHNGNSYNEGMTGNAIFNDTSFTQSPTIITGDVTFNNGSFNLGTITGNATFNDNSINYGAVTGDATFNDYSKLNDYELTYGATAFVNGDATFNNFSQGWFSNIDGSVICNDSSNINDVGVGINATFNGNSNWSGTSYISGLATFNDYSTCGNDLSADGGIILNNYASVIAIVHSNTIFNDNSHNEYQLDAIATFNDNSY